MTFQLLRINSSDVVEVVLLSLVQLLNEKVNDSNKDMTSSLLLFIRLDFWFTKLPVRSRKQNTGRRLINVVMKSLVFILFILEGFCYGEGKQHTNWTDFGEIIWRESHSWITGGAFRLTKKTPVKISIPAIIFWILRFSWRKSVAMMAAKTGWV